MLSGVPGVGSGGVAGGPGAGGRHLIYGATDILRVSVRAVCHKEKEESVNKSVFALIHICEMTRTNFCYVPFPSRRAKSC